MARLATDELLAGLEPWLCRQRWFAGKARDVESVVMHDVATIDDGFVDVFVQVRYHDGGLEDYQVPLLVDGPRFTDALTDPSACRLLAQLTLEPASHPTGARGELTGRPVAPGPVPEGAVRLLGVEQSNSSVVFGDALILKVFRKLEPGTNPDVELTRALTEAGFAHVPAQRGSLDLSEPGRPPTTLAVLSDFLASGREGWGLAVNDPDRLLGLLEDLGRAVAGAHAVLAERFPTRAATPADVERWSADMLRQLDTVLATASRRAADATSVLIERADEIRRRLRPDVGARDLGPVQRIHGDLHLGQVLWDPERGWQLLDFEGEPARPLAQRREPHSPLRDVAGMLRSFEYAAGHLDAAGPWLEQARGRFLAGYPVSEPALLAAFELDKAVYELGYELANRPGWVDIPVRGILSLLKG